RVDVGVLHVDDDLVEDLQRRQVVRRSISVAKDVGGALGAGTGPGDGLAHGEGKRRVVARQESPGPEQSEDQKGTAHQSGHGEGSTLTTGYGAFKTGFLLKPANGGRESRPRLQVAPGKGSGAAPTTGQ